MDSISSSHDRLYTEFEIVTNMRADTVQYCAATCWALSRQENLRKRLVEHGALERLVEAACWSFGLPYDMAAYTVRSLFKI